MKPSLRQILADSHVAAVAIAMLLLWSLDTASRGFWIPVFRAAAFLFTAIAILDIPYFSPTLTVADRFMLVTTSIHLYLAVVAFSAAWLLSRWIYGVGPIRSLARYYKDFSERKHA
jgi:hypothetical protein